MYYIKFYNLEQGVLFLHYETDGVVDAVWKMYFQFEFSTSQWNDFFCYVRLLDTLVYLVAPGLLMLKH